eukprot:SAG11_NODE_28497_length_321_cov_0.333333_1_plen_22_part_10
MTKHSNAVENVEGVADQRLGPD